MTPAPTDASTPTPAATSSVSARSNDGLLAPTPAATSSASARSKNSQPGDDPTLFSVSHTVQCAYCKSVKELYTVLYYLVAATGRHSLQVGLLCK